MCSTPPTINEEATLRVDSNICVTATLEVLRAIGKDQGPRQSLFALGYAGWAPGQLDAEIQANGWLCVAADNEIVFDFRSRWEMEPGPCQAWYRFVHVVERCGARVTATDNLSALQGRALARSRVDTWGSVGGGQKPGSLPAISRR